jgi:photosystem II stability/assembly factor-like uncharacterized protein
MAVAPTNPDVVVVGTAAGAYRSSDGGKTWQATGPKGINATSLVQAGSDLFLGGAALKASEGPIVRIGAARAAAAGNAVLAESSDGGVSWQVLHPRGLPDVSIQALAVGPGGGSTLYALLNTGKLYRSTDGARSFTLATSHFGVPPWALAVTQMNDFVAGNMDTGAYVGTASAFVPTGFKNTLGSDMVMEYAVQPGDSSHVLMTAYGVESSSDAGKTWHVALNSKVMFGPVAWSSSQPDTAYAVDFDGNVWHTTDGGSSWSEIT